MPRYIDANKARNIENLDNYGAFALGIGTISDVQEVLDDAPTADVAPVVRGEWVGVAHGRGGHECSKCRGYAPSFQNGAEYLSSYCPNCGAKMHGG